MTMLTLCSASSRTAWQLSELVSSACVASVVRFSSAGSLACSPLLLVPFCIRGVCTPSFFRCNSTTYTCTRHSTEAATNPAHAHMRSHTALT